MSRNKTHNPLFDLNYWNNQECEEQRKPVLKPANLGKIKDFGKRRFYNHKGQKQRKRERPPQPPILALKRENRFAKASHIERVEHLNHRKREECHGHTLHTKRWVLKNLRNICRTKFNVVAHKIADKCQHRNGNTLKYHVDAHTTSKNAVLRTARAALHNTGLFLLARHRERGQRVGDEIDPQQVRRFKNGKSDKRRHKDRNHFGQVRRQEELNAFADIVVDSATLAAGIDNRRKIVVCKHHIGHILGDVGTSDTHTNTDICAFDGRSIIYSVSGHRDDLAFCFPGTHNAHLVLGLHTGKNTHMFNARLKFII